MERLVGYCVGTPQRELLAAAGVRGPDLAWFGWVSHPNEALVFSLPAALRMVKAMNRDDRFVVQLWDRGDSYAIPWPDDNR